MVEFALILPVMLLVIFVIIELARLLAAYLAIENGARFGVRYAVTGEYNAAAYCPGGVCTTNAEEDAARLLSIKDTTRAGSVGILRNETVAWNAPGYFKMTVCSSRDLAAPHPNSDFTWFPADPATFNSAYCSPTEDVGGPGDRVSVTVDFNHPLIVPILSTYWPKLHLTAKREGIIEQFRVARVVGLPATISVPTFTPTTSPTPTDTPIPSDTPTATETETPTETDTPTQTFTPSHTPTPTHTATTSATATVTPTPDCSDVFEVNTYLVADDFRMDVRNNNPTTIYLTNSTVTWTSLNPGVMYLNNMDWNFATYYGGDDYTSPTSGGGGSAPFPSGLTLTWRSDFNNVPGGVLTGSYAVTLIFDGRCAVSGSVSVATPTASFTPSRTPTPTITYTPSRTFTPTITRTPTNTFTPSRTPTRTNTPPPTNTPTRTNTPTDTRTPTHTYTPSRTPTPPDTPTRTPTRTPTNTSVAPTPTNTRTPTPTRTPACMEC